jgi:CTP synthase
MKWEMQGKCLVVHLTLVPYLAAAGELKTKPTQHSVKTLLESGVQPDIIVCRTEKHLNQNIRNKIALFCNVEPTSVIESIDARTIYEVPLLMRDEKLDIEVLRKLNLPADHFPDLSKWEEFVFRLKNPNEDVRIALVGKYVELKDAYKSIQESLVHAGAVNQCKVHVSSIHSEGLNDDNCADKLKGFDGILVAPGFGHRGIEGKISAIRFARENKVPFLGICLGMQCAVVEFGRNVLGLKGAHSTEMDAETPYPVIDMMEEQKKIMNKGGTMRLGVYPCRIIEGTKVEGIYNTLEVSERHRHRYEFNNQYLDAYEKAGMIHAGINPQQNLVEIIELKDHPWFIGVQFHPEYRSTVDSPHPLFVGFIGASIMHKQQRHMAVSQ